MVQQFVQDHGQGSSNTAEYPRPFFPPISSFSPDRLKSTGITHLHTSQGQYRTPRIFVHTSQPTLCVGGRSCLNSNEIETMTTTYIESAHFGLQEHTTSNSCLPENKNVIKMNLASMTYVFGSSLALVGQEKAMMASIRNADD